MFYVIRKALKQKFVYETVFIIAFYTTKPISKKTSAIDSATILQRSI